MWPFDKTCQSNVRLVDKTVVITGANIGIGKETARDLYWRGARVILACRDLVKAEKAIEEIKTTPPSKPERVQFKGGPGHLSICQLDLCSFASVRKCAKTLIDNEPKIHILINNAGVAMCPFAKTEDGYETHLQSNYLGHFLFTLLLLPKLRDSVPSRVINVSSMMHYGDMNFDDLNMEKSYSPMKAYFQSKLANILSAKELDNRMKASKIEGITTYSLHPGVVSTSIFRHLDSTIFCGARKCLTILSSIFSKNAELGAQTTIHCATDEKAGKESGLYYSDCAVAGASSVARNPDVAKKLWDISLQMVDFEVKENLSELVNRYHLDSTNL